MKLFKD